MTAERYRRLPGRRRGILGGASVWIGSDHLLSVRSMRFRESYKRYYLRDVQAIAVARKARFHISMRSLTIGLLLLWSYLLVRSRWDWADQTFWGVAICLAAAWFTVSSVFSCTCRIYTAVSRDELPSIYRTWTARRFLAKVDPLIAQTQGTIEGDWTGVVEPKGVGPALPPPTVLPDEPVEPVTVRQPAPVIRIGTAAVYVFIATLIVDAGFTAATLRSESRTVFWTLWAITLARVATAILIFVQHFRKRVPAGMQKLAIISLVMTGILYYLQQISGPIRAAALGITPDPFGMTQRWTALSQVDVAINVALGLTGLAMIWRSES